MRTLAIFSMLCFATVLFGCGEKTLVETTSFQPTTVPGVDKDGNKADRWTAEDNPALFSGDLQYDLDQLPLKGEAANIPWAGSYWPVYQDSINYKWDGSESMSASAKYGTAFGIDGIEDLVSRHHGIDGQTSRTPCTEYSDCSEVGGSCAKRPGSEDGYCIPTWWGICHAWAPVAILEPEPLHPVVKNGVNFKVNDIKALLELTYNRSKSKFVSLRCNKDGSEDDAIEYDEYERPTGSDAQCKDTNPGTYHVLLANYLGINQISFVEDRTWDAEVWNQPLRGYRITQQNEIDAQKANQLVGVTAENMENGEVPTDYLFNDDAVRLFHVNLEVDYIAESPSSTDGNLADRIDNYTRTDKYDYVLEVDQDNKVIGGEWVGNSKKNHPDFLWLPTGRYFYPVAGGSIEYSKVKELLNMSLAGESEELPEEVGTTVEESGTVDAGEWAHFGPYDHTSGVFDVELKGEGDADLYVKSGDRPSLANYDCRPYTSGISEGCSLNGPGSYFVSVFGNEKSDFVVSISFNPADAATGVDGEVEGPAEPTSGAVTKTATGSVASGSWQNFGPYINAEGSIKIVMTGSGDADLYVNEGAEAGDSEWDCRPYVDGSDEE